MKKTLFIAMLAAALLGNADAEYIPTAVDGGTPIGDKMYAGEYSENQLVYGGSVTVRLDERGTVSNDASVYGGYTSADGKGATRNSVTMAGGGVFSVYGGYAESGDAYDNSVTMDGGGVSFVYGGYAKSGDATINAVTINGGNVESSVCAGFVNNGEVVGNIAKMNRGSVGALFGGHTGHGSSRRNSVVITGGSVGYVFGGTENSSGEVTGCEACDNTVILTGGTVGDLYGGASMCGTATGNTVRLVGEGATYTLGDTVYEGSDKIVIQGGVHAGYLDNSGASLNNSVDIYGTGISIGGTIDYCQQLNFHIANIDDGASPMITLLSESLDLANFLVPTEEMPNPELALTFDAMEGMEWKPGASVTLVNAAGGIKIDESLLNKEYNIYRNGDPDKTVLGTATLKLEQGTGTTRILKLVTNGNVPEPTTGTLGLLALAALAARRKRDVQSQSTKYPSSLKLR